MLLHAGSMISSVSDWFVSWVCLFVKSWKNLLERTFIGTGIMPLELISIHMSFCKSLVRPAYLLSLWPWAAWMFCSKGIVNLKMMIDFEFSFTRMRSGLCCVYIGRMSGGIEVPATLVAPARSQYSIQEASLTSLRVYRIRRRTALWLPSITTLI